MIVFILCVDICVLLQVLVFIKSDFWEFYSAFQSSLIEQDHKVLARRVTSVHHLNFFPSYLGGEATDFAHTEEDAFINYHFIIPMNS